MAEGRAASVLLWDVTGKKLARRVVWRSFVNKQGDGGQIPGTHNRYPSATEILKGGAG